MALEYVAFYECPLSGDVAFFNNLKTKNDEPLNIEPFMMLPDDADDKTIQQFKRMFNVLYQAAVNHATFITNA